MRAIEAEQAILGSLLLSNAALLRIPELKVSHFSDGGHRSIFTEICRQIHAGKAADIITVYHVLNDSGLDFGGLPYLNQLSQNTPSAVNIRYYADIVIDSALRQSLVDTTVELAAMVSDNPKVPAPQLLENAMAAISRLAETQLEQEPLLARQALQNHVNTFEDRFEKKSSAIPTGFEYIDRMLNGGVNRGDLLIVGARPSMGKTAWALNVATAMAVEYTGLFLSQEMTSGQLLDRLGAALGSIDLGAIIRGDMSNDAWTRYTAACSRIEALKLHIDDQGSLTIISVKNKARKIKRSYGLDFIVLDYLQLMAGDAAKRTRNEQIEAISRELKGLAKELNIAVIALSQLNREVERRPGRRPTMADLRDSGAIEQDADVIVFIHREEVGNPETHLIGWADFIFAKNRQGQTGDVALHYEGRYTRFETAQGYRPQPARTQPKRGLAEHL
ncbi:replicative DNA helicase [Oxalobacter vibrioformis]|uniref:Replicative DNA helicase n=1 Tax=Oxalobacter vibrioformis TaxID=933080 RepID=A0A9E9LYT2_9BURK|nr:replicative DNA helicase [Oxalobacter vibrioformis]WAW11237.1 replicative DNA helicase [Oxalobacter vibrioformis]